MASTPAEILKERLEAEFDQTYTLDDIINHYREENGIIEGIISDEELEEWKEVMFEEYCEHRCG